MKKIIFSALVAFVAIGGAFASNSVPSTLYISGPQGTPTASCSQKDLNCQPGTANPCTFNGVQQFQSDGTECIIQLSERP